MAAEQSEPISQPNWEEPQFDQGVPIEPYRGPMVGPAPLVDEAEIPPLPELKDVPEARELDHLPPAPVYQRGFVQPIPQDGTPGQLGDDRAIKRGQAGLRLLAITWLLWLPGLLLYAATHVLFSNSGGVSCAGPFFLVGDIPILLAPAYSIVALVGSVESRKPRQALILGTYGLALDLLTWLIVAGLLNYIPFRLQ